MALDGAKLSASGALGGNPPNLGAIHVYPPDPPATAVSMVEILRLRADATPDSLAFSFLVDGEAEGPRLTFGDLDRQARSLAATLQEKVDPGDRALLVYAPGLEFVPALFGCFYAGVLPVPVYPPRLDRPVESWQTLAKIRQDCQSRLVLTTRSLAASLANGLPDLRILCTDDAEPSRAQHWREPRLDGGAVALLQYTSGSTAAPKGVMVTHRNLLHNSQLIRQVFEHSGPGLGVCWLPLYHDMGLVGGVLQAVYHGGACVLLSPLGMLQRPFRWLQAISRYRADTSAGPSFAYDLCVQRITREQKSQLDLRNWSIAGIGSEVIHAETIERFSAAFAPCGFRPEAFCPGYGLAEATMLVTCSAKSALPVLRSVDTIALRQGRVVTVARDSQSARTLVGCGHTWLGQQIRIVDPQTRCPCPPATVGEIWVRGPSVAKGYWNRPEETAQTFYAVGQDSNPAGNQAGWESCPTNTGPFLRTGDLGFVQNGELYITGRCKDLIVIHGRNHYPQEIESTVQAVHPGLRPEAGAAFEIDKDARQLLVVVQEVERRCRQLDPGKVVGDIRQAVAEQHQLQVYDVQFLESGSLPRTSSGKIQRHACRLGYEQQTLRRWKGTGT